MKLTTKQAAQGFQVTPKTIAEWVKRGCPKIKHGEFDFFIIVSWWAENIHRPETKPVEDSKALYWQARARRETVKANEAENLVVPAEQVRDESFMFARMTRDAILAVPDKIGAELAGSTDIHTVTQKLTVELLQALEELSNLPDCIKEPKVKGR